MDALDEHRRMLEQRITDSYAEAQDETRKSVRAMFEQTPVQFNELIPMIETHIGLRLQEAHERHFWGFEPCGLTHLSGVTLSLPLEEEAV